jgi:hypothetical protein
MPTRCSTKRRATLRLRGASPVSGLGVPRPEATRAVRLRVWVATWRWGCAGRTGARSRDLALGTRRVDPVAGLEATAVGASRHSVNTFHLQRNTRVDAQLLTRAHARRRRAWVKITPRTQCAAAASLAARLAGGLAWSSRDVRWPQPCVAHARPRLARSAQPPGNKGRVTRRSGGARRPLHSALGSKAGDHRWSSHGDGGPGGMDGPGAPHNRGVAVLQLEGRQPGMDM